MKKVDPIELLVWFLTFLLFRYYIGFEVTVLLIGSLILSNVNRKIKL